MKSVLVSRRGRRRAAWLAGVLLGVAALALLGIRFSNTGRKVASVYTQEPVTRIAASPKADPFTPEERRPWFDAHAATGRHRLLAAVGSDGALLGYATTSRFRSKAAYDTTVEASIYCDPKAVGVGCGSALYSALFESIRDEDIHCIVAGVSLPNPASIRLHERFGFEPVGVFRGVGRKFGRFWDVAWFERPLRR